MQSQTIRNSGFGPVGGQVDSRLGADRGVSSAPPTSRASILSVWSRITPRFNGLHALALQLASALAATATPLMAATAPMQLHIDARDVLTRRQHVHIAMPASPGPLALAYPKWVPGEHRPNGPITQLLDLHVWQGDQELPWRRDAMDAFVFHVDVPQGAHEVTIDFDYLSPSSSFGTGFGKSPNVTPHLAEILFGQLLLYPASAAAASYPVQASVQFPKGWAYDGALAASASSEGSLTLPTVPLARLVDAPMLAGKHTRRVMVPSHAGQAALWIASDDAAALTVPPAVVASLGHVMDEMAAILGSQSLDDYVWLIGLSDVLSHDGTEHLDSSDVRESTDFFQDASRAYRWTVLPHEFFHAWNGKFRRPAGLATANLQKPMDDSLLWVYEGLTRYYGDIVLPVRSGLVSKEQTLDYLAYIAGQVEYGRPGRRWRSVVDTAAAIPAFADAPYEGTADRRGADYYNEGMLVWLEADIMIRRATHGARSLDDFCRRFFAGRNSDANVRPYTRDDVIRTLHEVADIDWRAFLEARLDRPDAPAPIAGLTGAGWSVVYDNAVNPFADSVQKESGVYNYATTLGAWISTDGTIQDVASGSPMAAQSVASAWRITRVNDSAWSLEALDDALRASSITRAPLSLTVTYQDVQRTVAIDWHGGLRIPHLQRTAGTVDLLSLVLDSRDIPARTQHAKTQENRR